MLYLPVEFDDILGRLARNAESCGQASSGHPIAPEQLGLDLGKTFHHESRFM
jgi:hypothetical protein